MTEWWHDAAMSRLNHMSNYDRTVPFIFMRHVSLVNRSETRSGS